MDEKNSFLEKDCEQQHKEMERHSTVLDSHAQARDSVVR